MKVVIWIVSDLVLNESIDGASLATQGNIVNLKLFMKFGIYKIYKKKRSSTNFGSFQPAVLQKTSIYSIISH